jgi:hypothetical protein
LAQTYRYIDSAGNINFVDRISDVPPEYRSQVMPPTPTPIKDPKLLKKIERERRKVKPTRAPKPTRTPRPTKTPRPVKIPTIAKPYPTSLPTRIPPLSEPAPSPFQIPDKTDGTKPN